MKAEIIAVGTEILLGDILNTNAQYLSVELAALGFSVYYQSVVGDNAGRLLEVVETAKARSQLIIITGGLGPTDDDLTKETVALSFADKLLLDNDELKKIQSYFSTMGKTMPKNNIKQAMVPSFGSKLLNDVGTAPGAIFYDKATDIIAMLLPGPPKELTVMWERYAREELKKYQTGVIYSTNLSVYGIGESEVELLIKNFIEAPNPTTALYAKTNEVRIRITAKAATAAEAMKQTLMVREKIQLVLRENIYGENTESFEQTVLELLKTNKKTVATAESCTGGLLAERLTSIAGSSAVFLGGSVAYTSDIKQKDCGVRKKTIQKYGEVSGAVAAELAVGISKKTKSDFGVGITGIAGPDGGTALKPVGLVYVAVSHKKLVFVRKLQAPKRRTREDIRHMATNVALDMLRRITLEMELPSARIFEQTEVAEFEFSGKPKKQNNFQLKLAVGLLLLLATLAGGVVAYGQYGSYINLDVLKIFNATKAVKTPVWENKPMYGTQEYYSSAMLYLSELKTQNPDTAAVLVVNDASIVVPVLKGRDNEYYKKNSFAKISDENGAVFLDARTDLERSNKYNKLIYGGINQDGLQNLSEIADLEKAKEIQSFDFITDAKSEKYSIIAVFYSDKNDPEPFEYQEKIPLDSYGSFLDFTTGSLARSIYNIDVPIDENDGFMSISMPSDLNETTALVVVGKRIEGEMPLNVVVSKAMQPLMPVSYYEKNSLPIVEPKEAYASALSRITEQDRTNSDFMGEQNLLPNEGYESENSSSGESGSDGSSSNISSSSSGTSSSSSKSSSGSSTSKSSSSSSSKVSSSAPQSSSAAAAPPPQNTGGNLTVTYGGRVVTDTALNILSKIVAIEMSSSWNVEALKAQAVAAHTFILNQQAGGVAAPSVAIRENPEAKIVNAVAEVASLVMYYGGAPIYSPYFASSAGRTNSSADVWGGERPYLQSVDSSVDRNATGYQGTLVMSSTEVKDYVLRRANITLNDEPASWFTVVDKTAGGYNKNMTIGGSATYNSGFYGKTVGVTGQRFREDILSGKGLRSAAFDISYDDATKNFTFTTYGYGHGVGMSQWGAQLMAAGGSSYADILNHYYTGVSIK